MGYDIMGRVGEVCREEMARYRYIIGKMANLDSVVWLL